MSSQEIFSEILITQVFQIPIVNPKPNLEVTDLGNRIEEFWVLGVLLTIKGEGGVHTQYEISCLRPDLMEVGHRRNFLALPFLGEQERCTFFYIY